MKHGNRLYSIILIRLRHIPQHRRIRMRRVISFIPTLHSFRNPKYHGGGGYHSGGSCHAGRSPSNQSQGTVDRVSSGTGTTRTSSKGSIRSGSEDVLVDLLGADVGRKISGGVWGAFGAAKKLAGKSKSFLEERVEKAQEEGWVDTVVDTAKLGDPPPRLWRLNMWGGVPP